MKELIFSASVVLALMACDGNTPSAEIGSSSNSSSNDNHVVADKNNENEQTESALLSEDYSYSAKSQPLVIFGINKEFEILYFDMKSKIIKIAVPIPTLGDFQVSDEVPNHPEIIFYTESSEEGHSSLVFEIPLSKYLDLLDSSTSLPGGRSIPGVPGDKLPSLGFELPGTSLDMVGYLSEEYVAFFVESNLESRLLPFSITKNILNSESEIIGSLGWVSAKNDHKSGVFISARFPREMIAYIGSLQ